MITAARSLCHGTSSGWAGRLEPIRKGGAVHGSNDALHARLQRDALESIDKAWSARTITATRIAALRAKLEPTGNHRGFPERVRTWASVPLIDLLNAQNQYFNASVSLTSARGVSSFSPTINCWGLWHASRIPEGPSSCRRRSDRQSWTAALQASHTPHNAAANRI